MLQIRQFMKETSLDILRQKAAKINWFFCDIDGTLTDGGVYYSPEGEQLKKFSLRDGTGFFLLRQCGIKVGFITTENSPIVEQRAKKLKVEKYIFGTHRKVEVMQKFLATEGLTMGNVAFIGDELNDVKLLQTCGLSFAVGDAVNQAKEASDVVCVHCGGNGAFREAVEWLLALRDFNIDTIIQESL